MEVKVREYATYQEEQTKNQTKHIVEQHSTCDGEKHLATVFLQYWFATIIVAMCEKQMLTSTSTLYCSESCRRRDASSPSTNHYSTLVFSRPLKLSPPLTACPFDKAFIPYALLNQRTEDCSEGPRIHPLAHKTEVKLDKERRFPETPSPDLIKEEQERKALPQCPWSGAASYLTKLHSGPKASSLSHKSTAILSDEPYPPTAVSAPTTATTFHDAEAIKTVKSRDELRSENEAIERGLMTAAASLKKRL